jgi:hypothetical protein
MKAAKPLHLFYGYSTRTNLLHDSVRFAKLIIMLNYFKYSSHRESIVPPFLFNRYTKEPHIVKVEEIN